MISPTRGLRSLELLVVSLEVALSHLDSKHAGTARDLLGTNAALTEAREMLNNQSHQVVGLVTKANELVAASNETTHKLDLAGSALKGSE